MVVCKTSQSLWALTCSLNIFIEHLLCRPAVTVLGTWEHSREQDKVSNLAELTQMSTETIQENREDISKTVAFLSEIETKGKVSDTNVWREKQDKDHQEKREQTSKDLKGRRAWYVWGTARRPILPKEKVLRDEDREKDSLWVSLKVSDKNFVFYSECEEKTLSFTKVTLAAREEAVGEQEWKQRDQLGCCCSGPVVVEAAAFFCYLGVGSIQMVSEVPLLRWCLREWMKTQSKPPQGWALEYSDVYLAG